MLLLSKFDENFPVAHTWHRKAPVIFPSPKALCGIFNNFLSVTEPNQLNRELMKEILQTKAFKQQTSVMYLNHVHMHLIM